MISKEILIIIPCAWIFAMSAVLFAMMGSDKARAKRGGRRVSERALFIAALLGGGPGGCLGMGVFRHKTKHTSFTVGMPLIMLLNLALAGLAVWLILK